MPSSNLERVRRHTLPDDELSQVIDALIIMLEGAKAGGGVTVTAKGEQVKSADLTQSALEATLDTLSILADRGRVALCAVDDAKWVKIDRLSETLVGKGEQLSKLALAMGVPYRKDRNGRSFPFAALLDAFQVKRDSQVSEKVLEELLALGGAPLVALIDGEIKAEKGRNISRDLQVALDRHRDS